MKTQVNWLRGAAQKSGRGKLVDFSTRGIPQSPLTGAGMGAAASASATVVTFEITSGVCYDLAGFCTVFGSMRRRFRRASSVIRSQYGSNDGQAKKRSKKT